MPPIEVTLPFASNWTYLRYLCWRVFTSAGSSACLLRGFARIGRDEGQGDDGKNCLCYAFDLNAVHMMVLLHLQWFLAALLSAWAGYGDGL